MANSDQQLKSLLRRCEAVGWHIRRTSKGHYFVTAADSKSTTFAATGDPRAHHNDVAWANRHGLVEAETKLVARQQKERTARMAADRARIAQPAGPQPAPAAVTVVEPRNDDEGESVMAPAQRRSEDMYTETVSVDGDWAAKHLDVPLPELDGNQLLQRHVDDALVEFYGGIMDRKEWVLSPEGIALGPGECVLDGQHRLLAVIDRGVKLPFRVTYNCDPSSFPHLNTGKRRTGKDTLQMAGEINATQLQSALKLLFCYKLFQADPAGTPHWLNWSRLRPSNYQLHAVLAEHPEMRDDVNTVVKVANRIKAPAASLAVFRYVSREAWPAKRGQETFTDFWHQLTTGQMLTEGDPALTLRDWLVRHGSGKAGKTMIARRERVLIALFRAYNAFCKGERLEHIKTPDGWPMIGPYTPARGRSAAAA
jgi:hypothetical protein